MSVQWRLSALAAVFAIGLAMIGARLFVLQIVQGADYDLQASRSRLRIEWTEPVRGTLLDRRGRVLAADRIAFDLDLVLTDLALAGNLEALSGNLEAAFKVAGGTRGRDGIREAIERSLSRVEEAAERAGGAAGRDLKRAERLSAQKLRELEGEPQPFLRDVERPAALFIEANPDRFPGVEVRPRYVREYPVEEFLGPIVGAVGALSPDDVARLRSRGMFLPALRAQYGASFILTDPEYRRSAYEYSDRIGRAGLERVLEGRLRGGRGIVLSERLRRGRSEVTTSVILSEEPEPGCQIRLTVDAGLQRAAEEAMEGRKGALVLLTPAAGEVLALVSSPRPRRGELNRAVRALAPPASTVKIVSAIAAIEEGVMDPHTTVVCEGRTQIHGRVMECSHTHGPMDLPSALGHSCNCYFYEVARKLRAKAGPDAGRRVGGWLKRFGFASLTGIDLVAEELPGKVPQGDDYNAVIGQGSMLATPLQVARMCAAVANGGFLVRPHLVMDAPAPRIPLGLKPSTLSAVREGLRAAVWEGTAAGKGLAELDAAGKTGTAQVVKGVRGHSWFVGYAPMDRPRFVVCVYVEDDLSGGGAVAAPIAARVLRSALEGDGR